MFDPHITEVLQKLSKYEAKLMYLVCGNTERKEIAKLLDASISKIQKDLQKLLPKFGLPSDIRRIEDRDKLNPIYAELLKHVTSLKDIEENWPPESLRSIQIQPEPEVEPLPTIEDILRDQEERMGEDADKPPPDDIEPPEPPPTPPPSSGDGRRVSPIIIVVLFVIVIIIVCCVISFNQWVQWQQNQAIYATRTSNKATLNWAKTDVARKTTETQEDKTITLTPEIEEIIIDPSDTPTPEGQFPIPGSIIEAGHSFSNSGITVSTDVEMRIYQRYSSEPPYFDFTFRVFNYRNTPYILQFRFSDIHLFDDLGYEYPPDPCTYYPFDSVITETIEPDDQYDFHYRGPYDCPGIYGPLDPNATNLILHMEEIAGMQDLNWVFNIR